MNAKKTCENCIWYGQCDIKTSCEDYSPIDDADAFTYYETVLTENAIEYAELVAEMEA